MERGGRDLVELLRINTVIHGASMRNQADVHKHFSLSNSRSVINDNLDFNNGM